MATSRRRPNLAAEELYLSLSSNPSIQETLTLEEPHTQIMGKKIYVYLVMARYLVRIDLSSRTGQLEKVVDFVKQDLPVYPGAFPHNYKLYVVGGEKFKVNCDGDLVHSYDSHCGLDTSYADNGSASVHVLGGNNCFSRDPMIPDMNAAKVTPKVATVDGKIYVLSSTNRYNELPSPAFECYDSGSCTWEELPEPLHYRNTNPVMRLSATSVTNISALGNKIFIKSSCGVSYYHTVDKVWRTVPCDDYIDTHIPCPFTGGCFAQGKDGLVIAFTNEMLVAYMFDDQQLYQFHEELVDLCSDIPFPQDPIGFIRHLGNNRFCFVICEKCYVKDSVVPFIVSRFKVCTVLEEGNFFINAKILNVQRCFLKPLVPFHDVQKIQDIFTMSFSEGVI